MPSRTEAALASRSTFERLRKFHPKADCELEPRDPFRLLVAIVLSAQSTDVAVNKALPGLFAVYPDVVSLANAEPEAVAERISTIGMYRQKAKYLVGLAKRLIEQHGGKVPCDFDALLDLPGVGRKTANVLMGVAFGVPSGVVVDTHVQRLSRRLGWTEQERPVAIELDLASLFPKEDWIMLSHVLIFHGRRVCLARAPACRRCPVVDSCPSARKAVPVVGRPTRKPGA